MQLRHCHEVDAALRADVFLTTIPPAPPLMAMAVRFTVHVWALERTIRELDADAAARTFIAEPIADRTWATVAAAQEISSGHLVPLKKVTTLLLACCGYRLCTTTVAILESLNGT